MASKAFDWRSLAASDEELAKHELSGSIYAAGDPASWKRGIVAAYFKEDYLSSSAKKRGVGLLDVAAAPVAVAWNLVFGFPKSDRIDYTIGPEEAALVVRDGKALGIYNQARLKTGGTFLDWLKGQAGDQPNYRMMLADCSPFTVSIPFTAEVNTLLSRDDVVILGKANARLKVDPEHLENLLGLFRGRTLLHTVDFAMTISDKIVARVLIPQIREHPAAQVRANVGLQDKLRAECIREIETAYRDVGIILDDFDVVWELTEEELRAIEARRRSLEEADAAEGVERARRAAERAAGLEGTRRELAENLRHQTEMKALLNERERSLEGARSDLERQKAQLELQKVQLEMQSLAAEHRRLQDRLDREQNIDLDEKDTLAALRLKERKRAIEREDDLLRAQSEHGHERDLLDRYKDMTPEQLLAIKAATSPAAAEALAAKFRAEAAKAEDATARVQDMADKQVDSAQKMARDFGDQMGRVAEAAATVKSGGVAATCGKCGQGIQATWKVCPYCGAKLKA